MALQYPLVRLDDVPLVNAGGGADLKIPISVTEGSSTAAFHYTADPGAVSPRHRHTNCAEISYYITGHGTVEAAGQSADVRPGTCQLIPKNTAHHFHNSTDEQAQVIGFYLGAESLEATGFEPVDSDGSGSSDGVITVHIDDVQPENMDQKDGWFINDFRLPIGGHNGAASTLFRARFLPGAVHKKHRHENCEEIYYIISGHGLAGAGADRVEVQSGDFHYIPAGVEHWLHNLSVTEPIEVVGIYIDSGSVAETGYVYMGDVTEDDLVQRTA